MFPMRYGEGGKSHNRGGLVIPHGRFPPGSMPCAHLGLLGVIELRSGVTA